MEKIEHPTYLVSCPQQEEEERKRKTQKQKQKQKQKQSVHIANPHKKLGFGTIRSTGVGVYPRAVRGHRSGLCHSNLTHVTPILRICNSNYARPQLSIALALNSDERER